MTKLELGLTFGVLLLLAIILFQYLSLKEADAEIFDLKVANRHLQQKVTQARIHLTSKPPDKLFDQGDYAEDDL